MPKSPRKPPPKATKIQLRLRPAEKGVIARAAELRRTTLSQFMLENAYQAAQQVLADQAHFVLSPARVAKGLARHPIPIILLARLAVDRGEQGKGLGAALLKDALLRAAQASDIIGCRAVLVHAKDQTAKAFYQRYGFEPSPVDDLHLYLLMKDLRASTEKAR